MQRTNINYAGFAISLAVYALVAWLGARWLDISVWRAFIALIAVRTFFGVIEGVSGVILWRMVA